ncbi:MAG: hypothetical protein HC824_07595, partial [Synechococcales cyanobacterium RM1_1_8]|nr:hypothetical protein [Synechococcales cyanobacterium RM1_1_8]
MLCLRLAPLPQNSHGPRPPQHQNPRKIAFGTDGWRGIIAEDFTFERLYRAAAAGAQVLK